MMHVTHDVRGHGEGGGDTTRQRRVRIGPLLVLTGLAGLAGACGALVAQPGPTTPVTRPGVVAATAVAQVQSDLDQAPRLVAMAFKAVEEEPGRGRRLVKLAYPILDAQNQTTGFDRSNVMVSGDNALMQINPVGMGGSSSAVVMDGKGYLYSKHQDVREGVRSVRPPWPVAIIRTVRVGAEGSTLIVDTTLDNQNVPFIRPSMPITFVVICVEGTGVVEYRQGEQQVIDRIAPNQFARYRVEPGNVVTRLGDIRDVGSEEGVRVLLTTIQEQAQDMGADQF